MRIFVIVRKKEEGLYRLDDVFPGLTESEPFHEIFPSEEERRSLLSRPLLYLSPEDTYMYVDDEKGHIVIGLSYLQDGDTTFLRLDILHELVHLNQLRRGMDLFDKRYSYVDRPTEIEAYEFVVMEARLMGLSEERIEEYLEVDWVSAEEHRRLAKRLGVNRGGT